MHGFLKKVNSFGKGALAAAGTARTPSQAGKAVYNFGKAAAPVLRAAGPVIGGLL